MTRAEPPTIFALASGAGRAGVAVIRLSGPGCDAALATLTPSLPPLRRASLRALREPDSGVLLDHALVLRFAAGASYTGEPSAELHVHGGAATIRAVLGALGRIEGLREARPGEFARRAFANRRIDLAQVEALADLVAAETEAQRRAALRQSEGTLGRACDGWMDRLTRALALIEASIDFSDEELPDDLLDGPTQEAATIGAEIEATLGQARPVERLRRGFRVAVLGAPNAGKSSLVNLLADRDVALVSSEPGTTRDAIEVALDLGGYPVTIIDTAGLREASDAIETAGIERARHVADQADLRLWLHAPDAPLPETPDGGDMVVASKADLHPAPGALAISTRTGEGIDALVGAIGQRLPLLDPSEGLPLRDRHEGELRAASTALSTIDPAMPVELLAEALRAARDALGRITGRGGTEALLDVIFGELCLGK